MTEIVELTQEEFNKLKIKDDNEYEHVGKMKNLVKDKMYKITHYQWLKNMSLILTLEDNKRIWGNSKMKKLFNDKLKPTYFQIDDTKVFKTYGRSIEYVSFSYITSGHLVEEIKTNELEI